jgi:nicotinate-nucleotide pyrophosphorylase (carboxylating)
MPRDTALPLDPKQFEAIVDAAIAEDLGAGDITSRAVIPPDVQFSGVMAAREPLVVAGLPLAEMVFRKLSKTVEFRTVARDGDHMAKGGVLAHVKGPAVELLAAERTAVNIVQHLSGIATLTRKYLDAIAGTGAILLDTRKTIPGLRELQKYATRMGGCTNHRMRLDDGVLIKDNHVAVAGGVAEAIRRARAAGLTDIEMECDTLVEVAAAIEAGADSILFDNMSPEMMKKGVAMVAGRVPTEASGNVRLETIRAIAETGVTYISVGRLTHSAAAVNIGLDYDPVT